MSKNSCKFVRTNSVADNINILNFIYEKEADFKQEFIISASYAIYIVTAGEGVLHTSYGNFKICKGDVFFTFSAKPYFIEKKDLLNYIYISFIGIRASCLLKRLHIEGTEPVYSGCSSLIKRWINDFKSTNNYNIDLICEGLLLSTLAFLCKMPDEEKLFGSANNIILVKQYIDTHYTDTELNLQNISKRFGYNYRYLSAYFKKTMKIPFSEYITYLRLEHAKTLMDNGITNVQTIAYSSGYKDPLYFSTVFKKATGASPRAYLRQSKR